MSDTKTLRDALVRVTAYIERRKMARGLDVESIHGFDVGPDFGFELLLSDVSLLASIADQAQAKPVAVAQLRAERDAANADAAAALGLVSRIRFALGDNGARMQDELVEWCEMLRTALAAHAQAEPVQFEWPDAAVFAVMNAVGDGPYGEEDLTVTRRFLMRADEVRAEFDAAQQPAQKCLTCNGHGLIGGHMADGSGYAEGCPDCNPEPVAPNPAQPERQPLTERAILDLMPTTIPASMDGELLWFARALERAHGINTKGGAA